MNKVKVLVVAMDSSSLTPAGQLGPLSKKYTFFPRYAGGPTQADQLPGAVRANPEEAAALLAAGTPLTVITLEKETAAAGLAAISAACDRHTFLVVSAANGLVLAGTGANKAVPEQSRPCAAEDVVPTLCYLFGFPVPSGCRGAVLYQGLKDPDAPHSELRRLKDINAHLESAIERDNRAPWDKHDCA